MSTYGLNVRLRAEGKKRCGDCHRVLSLVANFTNAPSQPGGYYGHCRQCHQRRDRDRRWPTPDGHYDSALREDNRRRDDGLRTCIRCRVAQPMRDFWSPHICHMCRNPKRDVRRVARARENKALAAEGKRRCKTCTDVVELTEFFASSHGGHQTECKACYGKRRARNRAEGRT